MQRRPVDRAGAGAGARRARISREEVERAPLPVDEDVAEPGARHAEAGGRPSLVVGSEWDALPPQPTRQALERQRAEEGE